MQDKDALLIRMFSTLAADPETNLFLMDDGALGFGVWCRPIAGADQGIQTKLNLLINLPLPSESVMQFISYTSPDILDTTHQYRYLRKHETRGIFTNATRERTAFLESATRMPIDAVSGLKLHERNLLIVVRLPGPQRMPTEEEIKKAAALRNTFMQTVRSIGFAHEELTPERYKRFMETVLNHRPDAGWRDGPETTVSDQRALALQFLDPGTDIKVDEQGLWLGDAARVRTLHVKRYPEFIHFGMALRYIGDVMSGARGIRENLLLTANVLYMDQDSKQTALETDHKWTTRNATMPMARYVRSWGLRKESLDIAVKALEDGDRLVKTYLGMAIITPVHDRTPEGRQACEDASIAAAANARAYFRELGFQLMQDEHFCLPLFLQMQPFAADTAIVPILNRYITLPSRYVVPMLPVLGSWRGTGTPHLTLHTRDGQIMTVSPFDSNSGFNSITAAQTGKGKSFFTNAQIEAILSTGGRVWVIDVGYSYKNQCRLYGGQYMQFGSNDGVCLNPFSLVCDLKDEIDVLAGIIQTMAAPRSGFSDYQMSGVKRVMTEVFLAEGQGMTIDHLRAAFLAEQDSRLIDVGHQLFPFTTSGEYGHYFNGQNNIDFKNPFIVCELQELTSREHLQRVVLQQLMYQIQQQMDFGDRSQRKLLVIDEAWNLLAKDDAREFITQSYRRIRKHGGSANVITQSVNDLYQNAGALAIVENSANMYLLGQKAESINLVRKEGRLSLGEAGFRLLESVHTVSGEYSEILLITERGMGVGRLVVSDFQRFLFSTKGDEVEEIKRLENDGLSLIDAVTQVANRRRNSARVGARAIAA